MLNLSKLRVIRVICIVDFVFQRDEEMCFKLKLLI